MSKEAEEFLNNNRIDKDTFILVPKYRNGEVISTDKLRLSELLEAYHQSEVKDTDWISRLKTEYFEKGLQAKLESRVNTISDEFLKEKKRRGYPMKEELELYKLGWNDFKNKLLKK